MACRPCGELFLVPEAPARRATQGHAYLLDGIKVLSMESGERVRVCEIGPLWLGRAHHVDACRLEAVPMAYFRGEVPA